MKRIVVITEEISLDTNVVVDAFVVEFSKRYSHAQLREMLNLGYHQDVFVMEYKEGEVVTETKLGIREVK